MICVRGLHFAILLVFSQWNCVSSLQIESPCLKSSDGNLILEGRKGKNVTLISPMGYVVVNGVDVSGALKLVQSVKPALETIHSTDLNFLLGNLTNVVQNLKPEIEYWDLMNEIQNNLTFSMYKIRDLLVDSTQLKKDVVELKSDENLMTAEKVQLLTNLSRIVEEMQENGVATGGSGISSTVVRNLRQRLLVVEARGETIERISNKLEDLETTLNMTRRTAAATSSAAIARRFRILNRRVGGLTRNVVRIKRRVFANKCATDPCHHGGTCIDTTTSTGFVCLCPEGWEGLSCNDDVNECLHFVGTDLGCQNGATCRNSAGSYTCDCSTGWYGVHCTLKQDSCSSGSSSAICGHGTCISSPRGGHSYSCICDQGYKSSPSSPACVQDVDECAGHNNPCSKDPPVMCINTFGSFRCGPCPQGYEGNGYFCRDIDECAVNNGGCSTYPRVECINTRPFRRCGPCPAGYTGDGVTCRSIGGPCQMNPCHPMAICQDNPAMSSTYYTCTCRSGYQGNGMGPTGCQQIPGGNQGQSDLCNPNPCIHGTCSSYGSQYQCTCNPGYTGSTCNQLSDPCSSSPCLNGGTCSSYMSGFTCYCPTTHIGTRCERQISGCQIQLTGLAGEVQYPIGSSNYGTNITCTWTITVNASLVVQAHFTELYMGGSYPACTYDFLEIHDGASSSAPRLGKYCNTHKPGIDGTIYSHTNQMYLRYRAQQGSPTNGFRFTWNATQPVCGGEKTGADHGTITSPGYPGFYPPNRDCYWFVRVRPGKKIQFSFATVQIQNHPNCSSDFLEIRDGQNLRSPSLAKHCSSQSVPPPLVTSASEGLVHFHSDGSSSDTGFHITYTSLPGIPGCGGVLTGDRGTFSVPTDQGQYQNRMICEWLIRVHPHEKVQLNFTSFQLEHHTTCRFDVVEVRDGSNMTSPLLGRFCSDDQPEPIKSSGNQMLVYFKSDSSVRHEGFTARYTIACGGEFTEDTGSIISPYHPDAYPHSRVCEYVIRQPVGKAIILNFRSFDIEGPNGTCPFDYLEIRDGVRDTSPFLGKYCGASQHTPPTIISSLNALFLKFKTDGSVSNHGFQALYSTIDIVCGGIHHDLVGTINSPSTPGSYMSVHDCTWIIDVPPGHVVQIVWHSFAVPGSGLCGGNYVEIFDNSTIPGTGGLIGGRRYCGTTSPPSVTSISNVVTVHFHAQTSLNQNGFSFAYFALNTETACGGIYHTSSGRIQSPMFPKGYPPSRTCEWEITVKTYRQIRLNFTFLDLEGHGSDCYDYVEVRNGPLASSPLLRKLCGSNQTVGEIFSHSHHIYIKFVSDYSVTGGGFEVYWDETAIGCGGSLNSPTGEIISPGYPNSFPRASLCYWTIRVNQGSKILLNFVDLDLTACSFNYVEIRDGPYSTSKLIDRFCSGGHVAVNSTSNSLWIKLRGVFADSRRGFKAVYSSNCNSELSGPRGVIESPGFPFNYENDKNCTWTIKAPRGNSINITFSHFEMENRRRVEDTLCHYDFVEVRAGMRQNPARSVLGHYCGRNRPPALYSGPRMDIVEIQLKTDEYVTRNGFRLEYTIHGCGGYYHDPSGTFESPNYPNAYPRNTECEWHFEMMPGQRINITIHEYDIETSFAACTFDSLNIYAGSDTSSPRLTQLCHHMSSPTTVTTSGHRALVTLISDASVIGRGFTASYKAINGGCGGTFSSKSGTIHSSNYPRSYDPNSDCVWYISVDQKHTVELTFTTFDVESHHNCSYDNITIFDGPSIHYPVLLSYCGSSLPSPAIIRSSGNTLTLKLRSDQSVEGKGFEAKYEAKCGGILNATVDDTSSSIHSPGFPRLFDYTENCTWHITGPEGYKVNFRFTSINIQLSDTNPNDTCQQASVTVYNGLDMESDPLGKFCGSHIPLPVFSTGRYMTVHLESNFGRGTGFRGIYSAVDTACGGDIFSMSGQIATPSYPNSYPTFHDCIWTVNAGEGNRVQLTFEVFDVEESDHCNDDYVEVHAKSGEGPLLLHNCSSRIPSPITAADALWLRFRSDGEGTANGFLARYSILPGSEFFQDNGVIASPLFPHTYIGTGEFDYKVTVTINQFVSIMITNMAIEMDPRSTECLSSVTIYDGYTPEHSVLGTYCGYVPVSTPIVSSSNTVLIRFRSEFAHEGSKFRLTYQSVSERPQADVATTEAGFHSNCSFHIMLNNSMYINSPNYPNNYTNGLRCEWVIQTNTISRIYLWTGGLELEESSECVYDRVDIYDGIDGTTNWNKTKTMCKRSDRYQRVYSSGKYLRVVFISDSSVTKRGFHFFVRSICGGVMTESQGVITSNSLQWVECTWKIKVRSARTIQMTFTKFKVYNTTSGCENRYVMMYNGPTSSSPFLGTGRFCGTRIPSLPETSSNFALIRYRHAYSEGRDRGFRLEYKELGSDCGGEYHLSSDMKELIISSPNYPNPAHPHTECVWVITATQGKTIMLNFIDDFDISSSTRRYVSWKCDKAFVEVREGGTSTSRFIGKFCGKKAPNPIGSRGSIFYIRYYTDADTVHTGFRLKASIGTCGGTYRLQTGYLESPDFPANYPANINCSWNILSPMGHYLTFEYSEVKIPVRYRNCSDSSLTITDNRMENVTKTVCGSNENPEPFDTASNNATVTFKTGNPIAERERKFRLFINASREECGGVFTGTGGVISSPGYPHGLSHQWNCQYLIKGPIGRRIQLTVDDFDISREGYCMVGLAVYNGDKIYDPALGHLYCYSRNTLVSFSSSMNTMLLVLRARSNSGRGFKMTWNADQDQSCGGPLSAANGTIQSPGLENGGYNNSLNCQWVIYNPNPSTSALNITFTMKHLETFCNDYIEIRGELPSGEVANITNVCGATPEMTFIVPYPVIKISFKTDRSRNETGFSLQYSFVNCGGYIIDSDTEIKTPNFPRNYPANSTCVWAFNYPPGSQVEFNFTQFQLEQSFNHDFVKLYNGLSARSPLIAHYSGSTKENVISQSHQMLVWFQSDSTNQAKGFNATAYAHTRGCGGTYHRPHGFITSPGFNGGLDYPANTECRWILSVKPGYHMKLRFRNMFDLETSTNCNNDFVQISHPRESIGQSVMENEPKLCGKQMPPAFNSTSNLLNILFRTNENKQGKGFKIQWVSECGGYFTEPEGVILSPNHPKPFPPRSRCTYHIAAPTGSYLTLNFTEMNLRKSWSGCYDKLIIKYRENGSWRNVTVCGREPPEPMLIRGEAIILFQAGYYTRSVGFHIRYKVQACGGNITEPGDLTIPTVNNKYSKSMNCEWKITAPDHQVVIMKFQSLDLESHANCQFDYVSIYKGTSVNEEKLIQRFCGDHTSDLPVLSTNASQVTVDFVSDQFYQRTGFKATIQFITACGGSHLLPNAGNSITIRSPDVNNDANYEPYLSCTWNIVGNENMVLALNFSRLEIEGPTENDTLPCPYDYLQIFDGPSEFSPRLGLLCGSGLPNRSYVGSHNMMTLKFVSDSEEEMSGFTVLVTNKPRICGGHYTATNTPQTIESPGYSEAYPNSLRCLWSIEAPINRSIVIDINEINIESSPKCVKDYLHVFEGINQAVRKINAGRSSFTTSSGQVISAPSTWVFDKYLCGTKSPKHIWSSDNKLNLLFHSDTSVTAPGFRLHFSIANCNRTYTGLSGIVLGPSFSPECYLTITAPEGKYISLYFHRYGIGYRTSYKVYDGTSTTDSVLANYDLQTRSHNPAYSTGSALYVKISQEVVTAFYRFNYVVTDKPNGCGGTMHGINMEFASPNFPNAPIANQTCTYILHVPEPHHVYLFFRTWDFTNGGNCSTTYLTVAHVDSNGMIGTASTFCENEAPATLVSSGSTTIVQFVVGPEGVNGTGWSGQMHAVFA